MRRNAAGRFRGSIETIVCLLDGICDNNRAIALRRQALIEARRSCDYLGPIVMADGLRCVLHRRAYRRANALLRAVDAQPDDCGAWLLQESAGRAWFRGSVTAMAIFALAVLSAIVYPHVSNKVKLVNTVTVYGSLHSQPAPPRGAGRSLRHRSTGFETRHPLVDIGGITSPGVLPYMGDLAATIRWAKDKGPSFILAVTPRSQRPNAYIATPCRFWAGVLDAPLTTRRLKLRSTDCRDRMRHP